MKFLSIGVLRLLLHRAYENTPTRAVEYMLSWMMVGWGMMVSLPGHMMAGPQYAQLLGLMPESAWGAFALSIGTMRLVALTINGAWARGTPTP